MTEHPNGRIDGGETAAQDDESAAVELDKDLVFELLKNHRRRSVLTHIRDHGETALGDLAEAIAAEENDTTVEELSADERKRVYIGLYQTHLPKMDGAGVVEYDQNRGVVSAGPAIDQMLRYLEPTTADDADDTGAADGRFDLSGVQNPVTIPSWALFAALLVVGLLTGAATALPGQLWVLVPITAGAAATWLVQWQ